MQHVFTGENDKLMELLLEGYDHIIDVEDEENHIFDVVLVTSLSQQFKVK